MLVSSLISTTIPLVKTSDTAKRVLKLMGEYKVHQLPIVNNDRLLGVVQESDLLGLDDQTQPLGNTRLSLPERTLVYSDSHFFEAFAMLSAMKTDLVPVIDTKGEYLGVVLAKDILDYVAAGLGVLDPGGTIVLEMPQNSYSLSEIGRICESNEAKVLGLLVKNAPDPSRLQITLKLNLRDLSRLISTFERFEYQIVSVVFDAEQLIDYRENYEALLRYLNP